MKSESNNRELVKNEDIIPSKNNDTKLGKNNTKLVLSDNTKLEKTTINN